MRARPSIKSRRSLRKVSATKVARLRLRRRRRRLHSESAPPPRRKSTDPNLLLGVPCSPGLAVGQVFQVRRGMIEVTEEGAGVETERGKLSAAIETAKGQLEALRAQLQAKADPAKAAIFAAHEELIEDPDLLEIVDSAIAKGKSAAFGWKKAVTTHADRLAALRNPLLAQRANDLRDVGLRVLGILTGEETKAPDYPPNTILIAEDLTPSDTAALDRTRVMGFATTRGGATSHGAILARSLGIPALAGVEPAALEIPNGTSVVLDGSKGTLRLNPPPRRNFAHSQRAGASGEAAQGRSRARARAGGHARRQTHRSRREHRRTEGGDAGFSSRRRRRRSAPLGISFHGTEHTRRAKTNSSKLTKRSRRPLAKSIRSSFARSTSAVTNHSLICRFRKKTIRFWANAACASRSIVPRSCAFNCAPFFAHQPSVA